MKQLTSKVTFVDNDNNAVALVQEGDFNEPYVEIHSAGFYFEAAAEVDRFAKAAKEMLKPCE